MARLGRGQPNRPIVLHSPTAAETPPHTCTIPRPFTGNIARPVSATISRPNTGTVARPC